MKMDIRTRWEKIYTTKASDQVSWYRPRVTLIITLGPGSVSVIDTATNTVVTTIPVEEHPVAVATTPAQLAGNCGVLIHACCAKTLRK
jgi:YVTN family beta-propeller protein